MIEIPDEDEAERAVWQTLIELQRRQPEGWTLIGAQMVALHGYEHGRRPPRRSRDADVLVDVRVVQDGTRRFAETLLLVGFTFDGSTPDGIGHRFSRGNVLIDVLATDGLSERTSRTTVPPAHTVSVPGGTQALERTEPVAVRVGATEGTVPRPNLLGAILVKARAVAIDDAPENQRQDLAFLCSLVGDPRALAQGLRRSQRTWLRQRAELLDPDHQAWQRLGAQGEDAYLAFRLLSGA